MAVCLLWVLKFPPTFYIFARNTETSLFESCLFQEPIDDNKQRFSIQESL